MQNREQTPRLSKREYVKAAVVLLDTLSNISYGNWAALYCKLRIEFFHLYNTEKLICSTAHGIEFFHNMLAVMEGRMVWKETDDKCRETEYSKNFNTLCI